jgi:hypothetical protein
MALGLAVTCRFCGRFVLMTAAPVVVVVVVDAMRMVDTEISVLATTVA